MKPTTTDTRRIQPARNVREGSHISISVFLAALLLFIVAVAVLQEYSWGDLAISVLLTLILVSGVVAIGARRLTFMLAAAIVLPGLVAKWINHFQPDAVPAAVHLIAGILFMCLAVAHFLRFLLTAPRVDSEVLQAGIAAYLVLGVMWTLAYLLVAELVPGSFALSGTESGARMDSFHALYFSFVTLTTMGYGDILPVTRVARLLAMLEATTGVLYMSVLIARLVGLYSTVTPLENEDRVR